MKSRVPLPSSLRPSPIRDPATPADFEGECWPTRAQELVLRAALASGDEAVDAWRSWREEVEFDDVDAGSFRLLPLVYRNVIELDAEDPLMQKLKGIYRRTWYRNQVLFRDLAVVLRLFRDARVDSLLLKGVPLVLLHYGDAGVRPMDDCDVLVPSRRAADAMNLLKHHGWRPEYWRTDINVDYLHGTGLVDGSGRRLDLHWHVLEECLQPGCDDAFWAGAVSTELHDEPVLALNPADQLLHVCVHGLRWNYIPPVRWIADAAIVVRTAGDGVDWDRLASQAESCGVCLPVREGLRYLRDRMHVPVPERTLQRLCRLSPNRVERRSYEIAVRRPGPWRRLLFHWYNHQRLKRRNGSDEGFVTYLVKRWGLKSAWNLPLYILAESAHILKTRARRRILLDRKS